MRQGDTIELLELEPVTLLQEIKLLEFGEEGGIEVDRQKVVIVLRILRRERIGRVIRRCNAYATEKPESANPGRSCMRTRDESDTDLCKRSCRYSGCA